MGFASYVVPAALLIWVLAWRFAGRWVPARRSPALPLVLVVVAVGHAAHVQWTALAIAVVGADILLTAGLGVVRGSAVRLTSRNGYLYRPGGWLSVGLWVLTIALRQAVALPFLHTSGGPALDPSVAGSLGIGLAVQYAVFDARVARDGRPIRPARREAAARFTLAR